jgi:hypothetical protein
LKSRLPTRLDLAADRFDSDKAGLQPGLLLAHLRHEGAVGAQTLHDFQIGCAGFAFGAILRGLTDESVHQIRPRAPEITEWLDLTPQIRIGGRTLRPHAVGASAPFHIGDILQGLGLSSHRIFRRLLQGWVERGVYRQAGRIELDPFLFRPGGQPSTHMFGEMAGRRRWISLALETDAEIPCAPSLVLRWRQAVLVDHLCQHQIAARLRAFRMQHGIVVISPLQHANQGGGLRHIQVACRFPEVGARRHFDAERVVQERDGVEVGFQDLVLAVGALDFHRRDDFLELAAEIARASDFLGKQIARQLLGDGRSALRIAACGMKHGRQRASKVDAAMLVKTPVLGRDQRIDHRRGNLIERQPFTLLAAEFCKLGAIRREDHAGCRQPDLDHA